MTSKISFSGPSTTIACLAGWLLVACGGGDGPLEPTSNAEAAPSASVRSAPPPDSASINGDQPFERMKAARLAATATAEPSSDNTMRALQAARSTAEREDEVRKVRSVTSVSNTIYVSPNGDDRWSGKDDRPNAALTDGPLKTIAAAQAQARSRLAAMAGGAPRAPVRVQILPGEYFLDTPLVFTPADSGTPEAMVYYSAVTPGTVLLSAGVTLPRSANPAPEGQLRFDVPAAAGSGWNGGGQLYVGGKRAVLARHPNLGQAWFVKAAIALPGEPAGSAGAQAFTTSTEATAWLGALSAADRSRAIVNVMQAWTDGHHRLSDQATPAGSVRITPAAASPFLRWGLSQRTYVENVAAALDAPGEWLWEASGARYIPVAGDDAASVKAVMPVLDKLVVIQGDIPNRNWVQNLWFSGITFAHTRHLLRNEGEIDSQAGVGVGAALEVDGAVGIVIDQCRFEHTGGYGVWFRRAVRDSRVTNSHFDDLGAGGVKLGQASQAPNELPSGANSAVSNRITNTGKVFAGAVAVWVGQGFDNLVANNAIMNTSYTGISVGWSWGYGETTSGRNRIVNNLLHNIGQGQLSDMGGIYTIGVSPGTVISGNLIREVRSYPGYGPGGWAIYNDEGTSNVLVENNIVVGSDSGGYHLNFGRDNTVRNNLFANGTKFEMRVSRTDPQITRLAFQDNLLVPLVNQPFDEYAHAPDVIFNNIQVSDRAAGGAVDITRCGTACTLSTATVTVGTDPRHVFVADTDAATVARFAQIARDAGPAWLVSPAVVVAAPITLPIVQPMAPPTPFTLDIAGAAVGAQPAGLAYQPGDGSVIGVVRDSTAPGGSCLVFNDSAAFPNSFFPYVYTSLNHDRGTSTAEFSVKIDSTTLLGYEWRDGGNPYKSGPAIAISADGIMANGRVIAPAPLGEWLTLRITAQVDNPDATWTLEVTRNATGTRTTFANLAFASAGWSKLIWMGFMANATTNATACLGSLKLTSSIL